MDDLIIIAVVLVIVAAAGHSIRKARKRGVKCIGCPAGCSCGKGESCGCGCGEN